MLRSSVCLFLLVAGCWAPSPPDGAFACNPNGKACPDGYSCLSNACWRTGHFPDLAVDAQNGDLGDEGPDMTPAKKSNGDKCTAAGDCGSGFCVDGLCCDTACTGQCEACDTQAVGVCSPVTGPPHGSRTGCAGVGMTCGGICDGSTRDACSYPSSQTICGAACDGKCSGTGSCSTTGGSCPNGFACGSSGCKTTCSGDPDCQTNFKCSGSVCVRVAESDCLDGLDNNGDGLADCADPTCSTQVECVPGVPVGDELGVVSSSSCPTNYGTTEPEHQQLSTVSCSGCTCPTASPGCAYTVNLYTNSACSGSPPVAVQVPVGDETCHAFASQTYSSIYLQGTSNPSCTAGGSGTIGTPSWSVNTNFCAASRSTSTCDSTHVCVAKPSSTTVCVRVPQAGASCPAGYTTPQTYYSTYQAGSCGACGCSITGASCGVQYISLYKANSCVFANLATNFDPPLATCEASESGITGTYFLNMTPLAALEVTQGGSVTCSASASATQPTPAGGSTICCQ